jgi:heme exporter protein D
MSEFLHMGGYAPYVWGSFGFGLAVLLWNIAAPALSRRSLLRQFHETE